MNSSCLTGKPQTESLGYVNHGWNPKSLYQKIGNFFIGMGPIFSGTAALVLGMYLFLPDSFATFANYMTLDPGQPNQYILTKIFTLTAQLFKSIFSAENVSSVNFWIYFALAIGISSHIALSKEDLKGAGRGLVTIFTFILLVNVVALILNADISGFFTGILALNVYLLAFSMISIVFSSIRLVLSAFAYYLGPESSDLQQFFRFALLKEFLIFWSAVFSQSVFLFVQNPFSFQSSSQSQS